MASAARTKRPSTARFERVPTEYGGEDVFFTRSEVSPKLSAKEAADPGAFLGRLWHHFGEASPTSDGFEYYLRDRSTGFRFKAYLGAGGPGYAGTGEEHVLRPLLEELERTLVKTKLVDCEISYRLDIDYGGAQQVIGCKRGRSYQLVRDTRTPPTRARTYQQCVSIATEYEGGYGAMTGWQLCLERVLPEPPEEVMYRGRRYDNCCGFTIERKAAVMLYCHDDSSPQGIPIEAIPFGKLPAVATLWLDSFERWKQKPSKKPRRKAGR
jgi:hypothetical protein